MLKAKDTGAGHKTAAPQSSVRGVGGKVSSQLKILMWEGCTHSQEMGVCLFPTSRLSRKSEHWTGTSRAPVPPEAPEVAPPSLQSWFW